MSRRAPVRLAVGLVVCGWLLAAVATPAGSAEELRIVYREGITAIQGRPVLVEVAVRVPSGADEDAVTAQALRSQGADPIDHGPVRQDPAPSYACGFFCFTWPQFADAPRKKHPIDLHYNRNGDPTGGGLAALQNAAATWSAVDTSVFGYEFVGPTERCPSLACDGAFDGFNDIGWQPVEDPSVLAVTFSGFSFDAQAIIEADLVLNTASHIGWRTDGDDVDVETVVLHELGHVAGLGHINDAQAVMFPFYAGVRRQLTQSEIDGITYLYPKASHPRPTQPLKPPPPIRADVVAQLGEPAPGGGVFGAGFQVGELNDLGEGVFAAGLLVDGAETGDLVLRSRGSALAELARPGLPGPSGGPLGPFGLGRPAINQTGDAAFGYGPLRFPVGVGVPVFRAPAGGGLDAVMTPGVTVVPSGGFFRGASTADLTDTGAIAFTGITQTTAGIGGAFGKGAYLAPADGSVAAIAGPGDAAPGGGTFDYAAAPSIADSGAVAFEAHVAGNPCRALVIFLTCREGVGIYLRPADGGPLQQLAGPPSPPSGPPPSPPPGPPPGPAESASGAIPDLLAARTPVINDRGEVAFGGVIGTELRPGALFLHSGGVTQPVALPGDAAPGGGYIRDIPVDDRTSIPRWSLNDAGDVAFEANLRERNPVAPEVLGGNLVNNGVYRTRAGQLELVARAGTRIPGLGTIQNIGALHIDPEDPDASFLIPSFVAINDTGVVVFAATLTDGRIVLLQAVSY